MEQAIPIRNAVGIVHITMIGLGFVLIQKHMIEQTLPTRNIAAKNGRIRMTKNEIENMTREDFVRAIGLRDLLIDLQSKNIKQLETEKYKLEEQVNLLKRQIEDMENSCCGCCDVPFEKDDSDKKKEFIDLLVKYELFRDAYMKLNKG